MYEKGVEPNSRSTSSDSSYSSSSNPGSVTPNYSNEKSTKNSSRKTSALSNFEFNDKKVSNFVNRDKVRLVRGKIVRGQKEMPKHFSSCSYGRKEKTKIDNVSRWSCLTFHQVKKYLKNNVYNMYNNW